MSSVEVELELTNLENEARALKAASEQSATILPVYTRSIDITTTRNQLTTKYQAGNTYTEDGIERVAVYYDTKNGANTIASLELNTSSPYAPNIRRAPYAGGAMWIISTPPDTSNGEWQATEFNFQVQSVVDGSLRAEEMVS